MRPRQPPRGCCRSSRSSRRPRRQRRFARRLRGLACRRVGRSAVADLAIWQAGELRNGHASCIGSSMCARGGLARLLPRSLRLRIWLRLGLRIRRGCGLWCLHSMYLTHRRAQMRLRNAAKRVGEGKPRPLTQAVASSRGCRNMRTSLSCPVPPEEWPRSGNAAAAFAALEASAPSGRPEGARSLPAHLLRAMPTSRPRHIPQPRSSSNGNGKASLMPAAAACREAIAKLARRRAVGSAAMISKLAGWMLVITAISASSRERSATASGRSIASAISWRASKQILIRRRQRVCWIEGIGPVTSQAASAAARRGLQLGNSAYSSCRQRPADTSRGGGA